MLGGSGTFPNPSRLERVTLEIAFQCQIALLYARPGPRLGASCVVLGPPWGALGGSWERLGTSWVVLRVLREKSCCTTLVVPSKIEPRTFGNHAPAAARARFKRFRKFEDYPSIWSDFGANLVPF